MTRKEKPCTCAYLTHPQTGAVITQIRFCNKHRPEGKSLRGKPVKGGQ